MGGTSLSAPAWAGLLALVNQGRATAGDSALNSTSPTEVQQALYSLPQSDYNAITSGSNGYSAGDGYNLVTGLGTPVANLLVTDLVAYQGPSTVYNGATVGPLQDASLNANWAGSGGPDDVFSVFDALTVAGDGPGLARAGAISEDGSLGSVATATSGAERLVTDAEGASSFGVIGSADGAAEARAPAPQAAVPSFAVDQVLTLVLDADSHDALIGDLAFEQVSSGKHKARDSGTGTKPV